MKPFDIVYSPLEGTTLIEASAGTGKTYTLEGIFLRLLLEKQLPLNQILVVTFTQAATDELIGRIRRKLVQAKKDFQRRSGSDELIQSLMKQFPRSESAIQLLDDALIDFDQAAIFTIHGFCQRMLNENSFETRKLFDTELIDDQTPLVQEAVNDFWRKNLYQAPVELSGYLMAKTKNPGYFFKLINHVKTLNAAILPEVEKPALKNLNAFRTACSNLKTSWHNSQKEIVEKLNDPALNGTTYGSFRKNSVNPGMTNREVKVLSFVEAMDRFLAHAHAILPLPEEIEKFTISKLQKATRKNQTTPEHPFFQLCDDVFGLAAKLASEMETALVYLKKKLFDEIDAALQQKKQERNVLYFDDLLILVRNALCSGSGPALADAVRRKYKAALIDEFQDTDSIQYEIFSRLFSDRDASLFYIGDPKQAIYGFRGADIFSYLQAAADARSKYTLIRNWRSRPGLVAAVNTLFSNPASPFVFDEIAFVEGSSAKPAALEPDPGQPPFTVWYLDSRQYSEDNKPVRKSDAVQLIADAVAAEITRLLNSDADQINAGDIAVLVRTNRQAQIIKQALAGKRIPSVLHSTGNIFDSHEAMELEIILSSIADPSDAAGFKAALAMDIMGFKGNDLIAFDSDSGIFEAVLIRFREYLDVWNRFGFIRMFHMFLSNEGVKARLLSFPDGERRLTNVLHLAEILHHQSMQDNLGPGGLVKWLAEQRDPDTPRQVEEHQLRLESDAAAVQIVTIHKSKGLEYSVVFCPYAWENIKTSSQVTAFHDPDDGQRLTYDVGPQVDPQHAAFAAREQLAENLRLLYVALTRAKDRCYLVWGRISTADTSALAYLLYHRDRTEDVEPGKYVKSIVNAKNDADLLADLERISRHSKNSIRVLPLPDIFSEAYKPPVENQEQLFSRKFSGNILRSWKISSYSSLISRRQDPDVPDYDSMSASMVPLTESPGETVDIGSVGDFDSIFTFPKGARAGIFFHDLFENLDFSAMPTARDELVERKLDEYGFDPRWKPVVGRMIEQVLAVPLGGDSKGLQLDVIGAGDRINELEFYFPLKPVSVSTLSSIFREHGRHDFAGDFSRHLETLAFSTLSGFMKGYIDMVFQNENRYYLVDWKSNYLGPTIKDYNQHHLRQTMQDNFYVLQYHLYVLALHQYLRLQKSDYSYENDFGGAFYIYIRGVDCRHGMKFGVFADLPGPGLVHALGRALIPDYSHE